MNLATEKNRWYALIVLALGLAIVVIDNTVLNVAIPYILRDMNASLDAIQWVISGYALIIATLLITMGRLGDLFGRKRIFLLGTVLFAIGSFVASISWNPTVLFIGEAVIEAIGAAAMMTSSLSLLVTEFEGRERPIAFGVWGSVAGASAALGPLLGGYLTTYFSWRWSLRINVFVAIIAFLGSVFIKESKGGDKGFDWPGTILSGLGLFSLVFALIEGSVYGWLTPKTPFVIGSWTWPLEHISIIPFAFWAAAVLLTLFVVAEYFLEKEGGHPMVKMSMFKNRGFSFGLLTLLIVSLGQFGAFFILPIFLQGALGFNALRTGLAFLAASITIFIFGPISGFIASRLTPKWVVSAGMFILATGMFWLRSSLGLDSTALTLAPALIVFGIGVSLSSSQLTNIILSEAPQELAGEASGANSTVRQIGSTIGIAVIGTVLAGTLASGITNNIRNDQTIPEVARTQILSSIDAGAVERGETAGADRNAPGPIKDAVSHDVGLAFLDSARQSLLTGLIFVIIGAISSLFMPARRHEDEEAREVAPVAGH